jgi:CubicO group peptidase (beta-lactamase class C family)
VNLVRRLFCCHTVGITMTLCLSPSMALGQGAPTYAEAPSSVRYADAIRQARRILLDTIAKVGAPGASIAIAVDGQIVWSEGFGFADLEERVPVTPLTKFRVGSVSKALTSAAIGQLVEARKLDLDAPIQRYVPSFPTKRYPITTRQVAGHLAGIRHYQGNEWYNQRHFASVAEGLTVFRDDSLLSVPGSTFAYSSYAWNLVSAVIEGASGEPFLGYMQGHVFQPLGMRHTVADHVDSLIEYRAHFYTRAKDGAYVNAPYVDNSYKWAGGGFLSTPEDLVTYGSAYLRSGLLRRETVKLLFTSQRTTAGKETGNGIGWFLEKDEAGRRNVSHTGGSVGGTGYLVIYPEQKVVAAMLVNTEESFFEPVRRIAALFMR